MRRFYISWIKYMLHGFYGKNNVMHRIMHHSRDPTELQPSPVNIRLYKGLRENYVIVVSKVLKIHAQYLYPLFPTCLDTYIIWLQIKIQNTKMLSGTYQTSIHHLRDQIRSCNPSSFCRSLCPHFVFFELPFERGENYQRFLSNQ